jgi:hypothetical protein
MFIYIFMPVPHFTISRPAIIICLKRYSSVGTAIDRTKAEISKDPKLKQRVEKLKAVLTNRQT